MTFEATSGARPDRAKTVLNCPDEFTAAEMHLRLKYQFPTLQLMHAYEVRPRRARVPLAAYILVATDTDPSLRSLPSGYEVALQCLNERAWGLDERTRKDGLPIGSPTLIYVAGKREHAQTFIAAAIVAGSPFRKQLAIGDKIWVRRLPLGKIRRFRRPVSIRPLVTQLGLASPQKPRWGGRLQRAVVEISEHAFKVVLAEAGFGRPILKSRNHAA